MFANLLQLITRRPPPSPVAAQYDLGFVKEVTVRRKPPPNPRMARLILICWLVIAAKCWLVNWLVAKYRVPFDSMWVIVPTLIFALLCTALYFRRE